VNDSKTSVGEREEGRGKKNASSSSTPLPSSLTPLPYRARSRAVVLACITTATFTDLVAYSVAVPVLPDYATRFQASPTMVGLLFASFGVTLLTLSIPMGAVSDRLGRKGPMIFGLLLLATSTVAFAYAESLPMLFVARLLQGAADGMTWIVGFAMIADLYGPEERGGAMGLAMAGSTLGIIVGPVIGGWLYQIGGIQLPFLFVSALALIDLIVFAAVAPRTKATGTAAPMRDVLMHRPIAICALVVIAGASTISMLEPVIPLVLRMRFDLGPAAIGTLFGIAAVASTAMHPIYGRLSDRWGGRRLMLIGLIASALALPLLNFATGFQSAAFAMVPMWVVFSMIITPSLAYIAEIASEAGFESYGVVYGVYNVAWAIGLMVGPAIGGFLLERIGFGPLTIGWGLVLLVAGLVLARIR
jgi:DHA1 family solute carrier family 18 vesicular amine transporter 1/2